MEVEKGKTAKFLKETRTVPKEVTEQLKYFTKTKSQLLKALKEGEKTIPELAEILGLPKDEVMFQLMSLLKYGQVQAADMDDRDEYFYYKLKDND
jgi:predicted transcriptional regulator